MCSGIERKHNTSCFFNWSRNSSCNCWTHYNTFWTPDWCKWDAHWKNLWLNKVFCFQFVLLAPFFTWWSKFELIFLLHESFPPSPYNKYAKLHSNTSNRMDVMQGNRGTLIINTRYIVIIATPVYFSWMRWIANHSYNTASSCKSNFTCVTAKNN